MNTINFKYAFISLIFFITFYPQTGNTQYYDVIGVKSHDTLNIRKEPDWRTKKTGEIPWKGRCIKSIGPEKKVRKALWRKIKYNNSVGWVNSKYLERSKEDCIKSGSLSSQKSAVKFNIDASPIYMILEREDDCTQEFKGTVRQTIGNNSCKINSMDNTDSCLGIRCKDYTHPVSGNRAGERVFIACRDRSKCQALKRSKNKNRLNTNPADLLCRKHMSNKLLLEIKPTKWFQGIEYLADNGSATCQWNHFAIAYKSKNDPRLIRKYGIGSHTTSLQRKSLKNMVRAAKGGHQKAGESVEKFKGLGDQWKQLIDMLSNEVVNEGNISPTENLHEELDKMMR